MSIVEGVNGSLMISYGVNDCESAVAYMELDQIDKNEQGSRPQITCEC